MDADPRIQLVDVDEGVLAQLVDVATTDAAADEVTPPVTDGPTWTGERIAWLEQFHRSHRDGGAGQSVWAVVVDDAAGEIGLWLRRSARGRGVGSAVVYAVVQRATAAGLHRLTAETTLNNAGARRVLERAGFTVVPGGPRGPQAYLDLPPDA